MQLLYLYFLMNQMHKTKNATTSTINVCSNQLDI